MLEKCPYPKRQHFADYLMLEQKIRARAIGGNTACAWIFARNSRSVQFGEFSLPACLVCSCF